MDLLKLECFNFVYDNEMVSLNPLEKNFWDSELFLGSSKDIYVILGSPFSLRVSHKRSLCKQVDFQLICLPEIFPRFPQNHCFLVFKF